MTSSPKKMGKRPGDLSDALKEKLSQSSTGDAEPGMRVQLARSISMVFAPSKYEASPDVGSVPTDSLELEHVLLRREQLRLQRGDLKGEEKGQKSRKTSDKHRKEKKKRREI